MPTQRSILLATDWFDLRLHRGVARFAREHGWHLSLEAASSSHFPYGWKGDGCIAVVNTPAMTEFIRTLGMPTVLCGHLIQGLHLPRIQLDEEAIGRSGAAFFLERGFRQLAFFSMEDGEHVRQRRDAFAQAAKTGGASFLDWGPPAAKGGADTASWPARHLALTDQLKKTDLPTGIFCVDDRNALAVLKIAWEESLDIPGQLAVLGTGDFEVVCESAWLPLSSVPVNLEKLGYEGARLLQETLDGKHGAWPPKAPTVWKIPPDPVIERDSTRGVAVHDPNLARVVRRIFESPKDDLSIHEMAGIARVGEHRLYELFMAEFHCTPAAFAEQARLFLACRLLADPKRKLSGAAREAGFGTPLRMHRVFMRRVGMAPGKWRKLRVAGMAPAVGVLPA